MDPPTHNIRFQFAKLFVSGMPLTTSESHLRQVFKQFGEISHCFVTTKSGGKWGGTGFVQFAREFDMESALKLNGAVMRVGSEEGTICVLRARPPRSGGDRTERRVERPEAQSFQQISLNAGPLPAGWQKASDVFSDKAYYFNQFTNEIDVGTTEC